MSEVIEVMQKSDYIRFEKLKNYDILIGIPSYNNETTISYVVENIANGLKQYFPNYKAIILNSDGGSKDRTQKAFLNSNIDKTIDLFSLKYKGIPGKGSAFRAIFYAIEKLNVSYAAVLDSDLRSIKPFWIERLLNPVINDDYDYVLPYYLRYKFDGTITNSIAYPLTACLYGKNIRQPIGGDFAFSRKLARFWLNDNVWDTDIAKFGIDIYMTTTALNLTNKICQAFLGSKVHDAKDPASSLGPMFYQVVSTIFYLMSKYKDNWQKVKNLENVDIYGDKFEVKVEPIKVSIDKMYKSFNESFFKYENYYKEIFENELFNDLKEISTKQLNNFNFPLKLWTKILYTYSALYQKIKDKKELINSLIPLYFARTIQLVYDLKDLSDIDAENKILSYVNEFVKNKEYLIGIWKKENLI